MSHRDRGSVNSGRKADMTPLRKRHECKQDAIAALLKSIARIERRLCKPKSTDQGRVLILLLERSYHALDYLVGCPDPKIGHAPPLPEIGLHRPVRPAALPRRFDATSGRWRQVGKERFSETEREVENNTPMRKLSGMKRFHPITQPRREKCT